METKTLGETFAALKNDKCDFLPTVEFSQRNRDNYNVLEPYLEIPYVAIGKEDKEFFSDLQS